MGKEGPFAESDVANVMSPKQSIQDLLVMFCHRGGAVKVSSLKRIWSDTPCLCHIQGSLETLESLEDRPLFQRTLFPTPKYSHSSLTRSRVIQDPFQESLGAHTMSSE